MPTHIKPFGFIMVRVVVTTILFFITSVFFIKEKIAKNDWVKLLICGIFGIAINQLLFFKGLDLTSTVNASLIMTCNPALVLIGAAIIIRERITLTKTTGILLGAGGAAILILMSHAGEEKDSAMLGDLCIFLNALSYALYLVMVKPLMKKYHPLTVIRWCFAFGLPFVVLAGFRDFGEVKWNEFDSTVWTAMFFVVIGSTFAAYLLNIFALRELSPSIVSAYIYVQPVVAMLITFIANHERLSLTQVVSTFLIFGGVYLVSKRE